MKKIISVIIIMTLLCGQNIRLMSGVCLAPSSAVNDVAAELEGKLELKIEKEVVTAFARFVGAMDPFLPMGRLGSQSNTHQSLLWGIGCLVILAAEQCPGDLTTIRKYLDICSSMIEREMSSDDAIELSIARDLGIVIISRLMSFSVPESGQLMRAKLNDHLARISNPTTFLAVLHGADKQERDELVTRFGESYHHTIEFMRTAITGYRKAQPGDYAGQLVAIMGLGQIKIKCVHPTESSSPDIPNVNFEDWLGNTVQRVMTLQKGVNGGQHDGGRLAGLSDIFLWFDYKTTLRFFWQPEIMEHIADNAVKKLEENEHMDIDVLEAARDKIGASIDVLHGELIEINSNDSLLYEVIAGLDNAVSAVLDSGKTYNQQVYELCALMSIVNMAITRAALIRYKNLPANDNRKKTGELLSSLKSVFVPGAGEEKKGYLAWRERQEKFITPLMLAEAIGQDTMNDELSPLRLLLFRNNMMASGSEGIEKIAIGGGARSLLPVWSDGKAIGWGAEVVRLSLDAGVQKTITDREPGTVRDNTIVGGLRRVVQNSVNEFERFVSGFFGKPKEASSHIRIVGSLEEQGHRRAAIIIPPAGQTARAADMTRTFTRMPFKATPDTASKQDVIGLGMADVNPETVGMLVRGETMTLRTNNPGTNVIRILHEEVISWTSL